MNKQKEETFNNKKIAIPKEQENLEDKNIEKSMLTQHIRVLDEDDGYSD